ncbi:MAG: hydroxyethylthiazole kinase [Lentisphaerae bacterium]|nr:hydroxyethylthiazole kinase [Lentisphaerota bacterium]
MSTTNPAAGALWQDLQRLRERSPLVHSITNYVVMNSTANALLALGASPVMAHAVEEVEDIVGIASALVINIGTLSRPWVDAMHLAMAAARRRGVPVVFDPVGAGASRWRTQVCRDLLAATPPTIVRGNASEIRALHIAGAATRGVDSRDDAEAALEAGQALAASTGAVVSISGPVDLIVGAGGVLAVGNGHPIMPRVTGLGCAATALTAAFAAVNPDAALAAAHAMAVMGLCGEEAAAHSAGPGSFQVAFLDALYALDAGTIRRRLRIERRPTLH